jgi:hypothetical protein
LRRSRFGHGSTGARHVVITDCTGKKKNARGWDVLQWRNVHTRVREYRLTCSSTEMEGRVQYLIFLYWYLSALITRFVEQLICACHGAQHCYCKLPFTVLSH